MPKKKALKQAQVFRWLARFYMRHPWVVLLACLAIGVLGYFRIPLLSIDTDLQALMPEHVPSIENLENVLEKTGSFSSAMVVITSPDPEAAVRFAEAMRRKVLLEMDWAASADYAEDFSLFEQHKLLYLDRDDLLTLKDWAENQAAQKRDEILEELTGLPVNIVLRTQPGPKMLSDDQIDDIKRRIEDPNSPVLSRGSERLFQSEDKQVTLLVVWPKDSTMSLNFSRQILDQLDRAAQELNPAAFHPDMEVQIGGRIYNRVVQFQAVINDVKTSGYISLGLIILTLTFYFRSIRSIFFLVVPLATGIIWTLGITQLVIGGLNLITMFLVLILFGLGIDFGIHSLSRYREARFSGADVEEALFTILCRTGVASMMAGLTTAVGFYALLMTDFRAFYEFGFIAGTGIVLTYISTYTMLPALLGLAEKFNLFSMGRTFNFSFNPFKKFGDKFPYPTATLAVMGGILVVSAILTTSVSFENDFGKLQAERSPEHEAIGEKIAKVFPDGTDRAVLIVDSLQEVKAITDYINNYLKTDTETPTIRKVDSIFSYMPEEAEQADRLAIIGEIKDALGGTDVNLEEEGLGEGSLQNYLDIGQVKPDDLPEGLKRVYQGLPETKGYLMYIFNSVSMYKADLARQFADDIREITVNGKTYHPATEALIFVDMLNLMKEEALFAILAVFGVTFLMLVVFFRSLKNALLVVSPTLAGLLILSGLMGLFDVKLSIFNMVILPTIIGIGVDNGIHIYHRYREEEGSVLKVLFTTGNAAAITTITTAFGFSGMLSADMGGLRSLGILATLGLAACLFTSWTLLPALLQKLKKPLDPPHIPFEAET